MRTRLSIAVCFVSLVTLAGVTLALAVLEML